MGGWRGPHQPAQGHDAGQGNVHEPLYGDRDEPEEKIIDVFICKLRKKLANASGGKNYIETVRGRGYALRPELCDAVTFLESLRARAAGSRS